MNKNASIRAAARVLICIVGSCLSSAVLPADAPDVDAFRTQANKLLGKTIGFGMVERTIKRDGLKIDIHGKCGGGVVPQGCPPDGCPTPAAVATAYSQLDAISNSYLSGAGVTFMEDSRICIPSPPVNEILADAESLGLQIVSIEGNRIEINANGPKACLTKGGPRFAIYASATRRAFAALKLMHESYSRQAKLAIVSSNRCPNNPAPKSR